MSRTGQLTVLALALLVAGATAVAVRRPSGGTALLAGAAGLGFAGVGIAARALQPPSPWSPR